VSAADPSPSTPPFDALPPFLTWLRGASDPSAGQARPPPTGSAADNVERALEAIHRLDAGLCAFVLVLAEEARARARALDLARSRGDDTGPLHGVTVAVKDCIDIAGVPTTCGTAGGSARPVPQRTASAVSALERAGALVVGKTNLHEWAFGATSDNPTFGRVLNPHDADRTPGGSSGGSAVAVATGMAMLALGTDTGGSVRLPASYCGVVGLKVTPGRIAATGVEPLSWTLDTVGVLAPDVADVVVPYEILANTGVLSAPTVVPKRPPVLLVETAFFGNQSRTDPRVVQALDRALTHLSAAGAQVTSTALADLAGVRDEFFRIVLTEGAAAHSGQRLADRPSYGDDIRDALRAGDEVPGVEYVNALRRRAHVHAALSAALARCDVIVAPVAPNLPERHGTTSVTWPDGSLEPALEASARLCLPASFAGLPAMSVPCGVVDGLPVGMQLIGAAGDERTLLRVAGWVEAALSRGRATLPWTGASRREP